MTIFYPSAVTTTGHGTVSTAENGQSLIYTPNGGYFGSDTFTYAIVNDFDRESSAAVTIFVNKAGNSAPIAVNDQGTLVGGATTMDVNLLANDSDPNGDPLTLHSTGTPNLGTVQNLGGGVIRYTRSASVAGIDVFNYAVTDGNGGFAPGAVQFDRETGGNHAPEAVSYSTTAMKNSSLNMQLVASDQDGQPLTYTVLQSPQHGTLSGAGSTRGVASADMRNAKNLSPAWRRD